MVSLIIGHNLISMIMIRTGKQDGHQYWTAGIDMNMHDGGGSFLTSHEGDNMIWAAANKAASVSAAARLDG
jgi:hypothetical protein